MYRRDVALRKNIPFVTVATAVVLTGTQTTITANPIDISKYATIAISIAYTRNGGSAGGVPIIALHVSPDPFEAVPVSVSHLQPLVYLVDTSTGSYVASPGVFTLSPSDAGTTGFGYPEEPDVTAWNWLVILMSDSDGAAPGTVTVKLGGTAAE